MAAPSDDTQKSLAHLLRTPINQIVGYAQVLVDEAEEAGLAKAASLLREIDEIGWGLHESVEQELTGADLARLALALANFRPAAEELSRKADELSRAVSGSAPERLTKDVETISAASRRLLALTSAPD